MYAIIVTVALFGLANIGTLIYFLGGMKARVVACENWIERNTPMLMDARERISALEARTSEPAHSS